MKVGMSYPERSERVDRIQREREEQVGPDHITLIIANIY